MASDFVQMDLLAWAGVHPEQQEPSQYPFGDHSVDDPDPVADIGIPASEQWPYSEEALALKRHPDTGMDGITADRRETIYLPLPKNIRDRAHVSLSCGDSGKWYCGWSADSAAKQEGTGFAACPKFSDAYASKYEAFTAAAEAIEEWFATRTQSTSRKAIVQALKVIAQKLDPDQYERDTTCEEWRKCGYAEQCFNQSLDYGPGPVCFKDQHTEKSKQTAEKSLADLCEECHAASICDKCCVTCKEPCNAAQQCRWPGTEG